jgi:acyl-CoA hydrolase
MARDIPKTITAEAAAARRKSGDWVDYGFGMGQPDRFDRALAARAAELRGVKVRSAFSMRPRAVIEVDPCGTHFLGYNWHFSGYDRARADEGRAHYVPMNFGEAPDYYRRFVEPIDVVCVRTCPMDAHGWFNFNGAVATRR